MSAIDVLIPTCDCPTSLVMTLSGLAAQDRDALRVVIADQGNAPAIEDPVVAALNRILEARGIIVEYHHREQVHCIAEQRTLGRVLSKD